MKVTDSIARRLYLRIWLAVAGSVLVLSLLIGWGWHAAEQERERDRQAGQPREVLVRNAAGELIGTAEAQPRRLPGQGFEFVVTLRDGQVLSLQMPPRGRGRAAAGAAARRHADLPPSWLRPPYGFWWLLALAGLGVMLGVYPVARRLTQRLEALQRGVQRWGEGDLSARLPESGQDEVADLSRRFNAAAERI
ncbi:MAG TPA: HAMP domain-containing protein, partial [Ottowia sp.]|nr:HAMP domain-containing protein [Ottowia sp.]